MWTQARLQSFLEEESWCLFSTPVPAQALPAWAESSLGREERAIMEVPCHRELRLCSSSLDVWIHCGTPQLAAASARDKEAHLNFCHLCSLPHPASLTLVCKCCQHHALILKQKVLLPHEWLSKIFGHLDLSFLPTE